MSELIQTGFDYAVLPADLAISLKLHEDRFIAVRNRATYEMGKEIYEAQQELANNKNGCFQAWVENLGISYQTGYDLIAIYQNAGTDIIKLFDNKKLSQTVSVMLLKSTEAVVEKALAKVESGEKVTVSDVREWKAIEAELEAEKRRSEEFRIEANQRRQTIRELEIKTGQLQTELEIAKAILDEKPSVVVQAPDDYKKVKEQAAKLKADLKEAESKAKQLESSIQSLKKEQKQAVDSQVNAKMREYQNELDAIEEKKRMLEEIVDRKKAYLDSLSSEVKRIETHQSQIAGTRLELISLAAFLNDLDSIQDSDTIKQWRALADMLDTAAGAIHQYINKTCSFKTVRSIPSHSEESLAS